MHVVMFSGGMGSYLTAKRVVSNYGASNVTLLFADTLIEDQDLYRFVEQASAKLGARLVRIAHGKDPWALFREHRFLGNTRVDICSRVLKREVCDAWLAKHYTPTTVTVYVGIDWSESHRFERLEERKRPWVYKAPLLAPPYLSRQAMLDTLARDELDVPRLYKMGFAHNNCGGFCVKAGQAHFAQLLKEMPERYAEHEAQEQSLREALNKDVAILRDRRGGTTKPLTMRAFRERISGGGEHDKQAWGGCGCFAGT